MPIPSLFTQPVETPLIGASILAADFAQMGKEAQSVLSAGADFLHFDVMDGHFVPNLTMGPNMCRSLRKELPEAFFDVHLMVTDPARFVEPFADAGANHVTFHVEAAADPIEVCAKVHNAGMTAGVALNPPTDAAEVAAFLEQVDLVLVMSVHPGFAGQRFLESVLPKAAALRPELRGAQRLGIDGGVNADTARGAQAAGCDVLVAASAIFGAAEYGDAIAALRVAGVPTGSEPG